MGSWILFLDLPSLLCFSYSAKQLTYWWHWGGERWYGMAVFVEAFGHISNLSCVYAVASIFGVDIWRSDIFHILLSCALSRSLLVSY